MSIVPPELQTRNSNSGWKDWTKLFAVLLPIAAAAMTPVYLSLSALEERVATVGEQLRDISISAIEIKARTETVDRLYATEVQHLKDRIEALERRHELAEREHE